MTNLERLREFGPPLLVLAGGLGLGGPVLFMLLVS